MPFTPTATIHQTQQGLHRRVYQTIVNLISLGVATEANIAAKTTYAAWKTAMQTTLASLPLVDQIAGARLIRFLDTANANSLLTDAQVTAGGAAALNSRLSTLRAYYSAVDTDLTSTASGQPMARE